MPDVLARRNTALNRLLEEFDRPPPVPPKDGHQQPQSRNDLAVALVTGSSRTTSDTGEKSADSENIIANGLDQAGVRMQVVSVKRKKVAFAQDVLSPPPISLDKEPFQDELGDIELTSITSVFDPPPAPRFSRFPDQLPEVTKRKPAPLNLNRPTSQSGKWKVHKEARESELWTPIDDEPDTASIISMDVRNAPKICPLPYKPLKSVPLRSRGSLRPAPLRIRKGVRFENIKSPAYLPLKSPALLGKRVRFDNVKSPAASRFRTPPTPFSSSQFMVLSPGRKLGVRFATVKSPATSKFKTPPTPYYQSGFRIPVCSAAKRSVRFDSVKSPASAKFKTPPTPFYQDSFARPGSEKVVKFAVVQSPAATSFNIPPTPYYTSNIHQSSSPPDHSPVTPRAMHITVPEVEPGSPSWYPIAHPLNENAVECNILHQSAEKGSICAPKTYKTQSPPRTTSLQHRRNNSLPKNLEAGDAGATSILPATTFDESAVGENTLRWLGMLPKLPYRVNSENNESDRTQILGSYFHRSRPSF